MHMWTLIQDDFGYCRNCQYLDVLGDKLSEPGKIVIIINKYLILSQSLLSRSLDYNDRETISESLVE